MLRAQAVGCGEHGARVADIFPGPHSGAERRPNFLDGSAIDVVEGVESDLRRLVYWLQLLGKVSWKRDTVSQVLHGVPQLAWDRHAEKTAVARVHFRSEPGQRWWLIEGTAWLESLSGLPGPGLAAAASSPSPKTHVLSIAGGGGWGVNNAEA